MLKYVFSRPFLPVESVISLFVAEDGFCIEQGGKTIFFRRMTGKTPYGYRKEQ